MREDDCGDRSTGRAARPNPPCRGGRPAGLGSAAVSGAEKPREGTGRRAGRGRRYVGGAAHRCERHSTERPEGPAVDSLTWTEPVPVTGWWCTTRKSVSSSVARAPAIWQTKSTNFSTVVAQP
eukprot:scaffold1305_cov374-Prasinococcus_capsulatus_cf.AAC.8